MEKQTAVEWLYEELLAQFHLQIDSFIAHELKGKLKQAKEMHKQEIENAYLNGRYEADKIVMSERFYAEKYYNKTFGGKDE